MGAIDYNYHSTGPSFLDKHAWRPATMWLKFKTSELKELIKSIPPESEIKLVGDHGVYIMSFVQPIAKDRVIVYAEDCDPNKDEDFYENKRLMYGGDDGVDTIGRAKDYYKLVDGHSYLAIKVTPDSIEMQAIR